MRFSHEAVRVAGVGTLAAFTLAACGNKEKVSPEKRGSAPQAVVNSRQPERVIEDSVSIVNSPRTGRTYECHSKGLKAVMPGKGNKEKINHNLKFLFLNFNEIKDQGPDISVTVIMNDHHKESAASITSQHGYEFTDRIKDHYLAYALAPPDVPSLFSVVICPERKQES
jgi:hypothetical protein